MFSLELPHRGDSNENTKYTIFNIKKKITLNYPKPAAAMGFFSKGLKNEFETAVVNEPSVFEPLKLYCMTLHPVLFIPPTYEVCQGIYSCLSSSHWLVGLVRSCKMLISHIFFPSCGSIKLKFVMNLHEAQQKKQSKQVVMVY